MDSTSFQQNSLFDLNMINNYDDDDTLRQQLHFNQILAELIENYENIDNTFTSQNADNLVGNDAAEVSSDESDDVIFVEEVNLVSNKVKVNQTAAGEVHDVKPGTSGLDTAAAATTSQQKTDNFAKKKAEIRDKLNQSLVKLNKEKIEEVDDDVCFLHEEEAPVETNKGSNYYENDNEVDEKEVMKRWRCKKLSDPKINLSKTNYRIRLFNDKNAKQPTQRKFKESIFENCFEISSTTNQNNCIDSLDKSDVSLQNLSNGSSGRFKVEKKQIESLNNDIYTDFSLPINFQKAKLNENKKRSIRDVEIEDGEISDNIENEYLEKIEGGDEKAILNKRIEDIRIKYKELDREIYLRFKEQKESLLEVHRQQQAMLQMVFEQQRMSCSNRAFKRLKKDYNEKQAICKKLYAEALDAIRGDFKNECKHIKQSEESQINALKVLFNSGKYEKGKLDQYFTLSVVQPAAKRRRYKDDGHRQVLLPEAKLRNIIIEDTIYSYYYGEPY